MEAHVKNEGELINVGTDPSDSAPVADLPEQIQKPNATQNASINYKSLLGQYAQKARINPPEYSAVNEGYPHLPRFRATVSIKGAQYTSPNTFFHRKAAEQEAARHAMENLPPLANKGPPIANKGEPFNIREDKIFCKSILNELVMKKNLGKPTYNTVPAVQPNASPHAFECTVVFNGHPYIGEFGRNKKEAEQLAARAVIVSLLESEYKTTLTEIIQSKDKLLASMTTVQDKLTGVSTEVGVSMENNAASAQSSIVQDTTTQVALPPHHEFKKPGLALPPHSTMTTIPPVTCLPPSVLPRSVVFVPPNAQTGEKKRKRNSKSKAKKKKIQAGAQVPFALVHPNQVTCPTPQ